MLGVLSDIAFVVTEYGRWATAGSYRRRDSKSSPSLARITKRYLSTIEQQISKGYGMYEGLNKRIIAQTPQMEQPGLPHILGTTFASQMECKTSSFVFRRNKSWPPSACVASLSPMSTSDVT